MKGEDFQDKSPEAVLEDKITTRAHEVSQFSATGLQNQIKKNIWIPRISSSGDDKIIKPQDASILVSRRCNKEVEPTMPQILLCFQ